MEPKEKKRSLIDLVGHVLLAMQRYAWEQGVAAQAFLESGDIDTAILLAREAAHHRSENGHFAILPHCEDTDWAASGEALLVAARLTGDATLRKATRQMLTNLLHKAPRAGDGTLYHAVTTSEIWIDSMYMVAPFLAVAGQVDEALRQIRGIHRRLWQADRRLYAHSWDEDKQSMRRAAHWSSGNGWAAVGLTRVIQVLPASMETEKEMLVIYIRDIIDGCLTYQRPDGLFHNVVDRPGTFVETNLAQKLAYAIYRGVAGGWLADSYQTRADFMRAAVHRQVDDSGYVCGVCRAPHFDCPGTAPEGQAFFILMEAAWQRTQLDIIRAK